MTRADALNPEAALRRRRPTISEQVADLPMFAPAPDYSARDLERLATLAGELALKAGRHGVTVADLRVHAVNRGLLTGEESGRRLSFLGQVMQKAGLVATADYRRSHIAKSHGNPHKVFVLPEFAAVRRATGGPA